MMQARKTSKSNKKTSQPLKKRQVEGLGNTVQPTCVANVECSTKSGPPKIPPKAYKLYGKVITNATTDADTEKRKDEEKKKDDAKKNKVCWRDHRKIWDIFGDFKVITEEKYARKNCKLDEVECYVCGVKFGDKTKKGKKGYWVPTRETKVVACRSIGQNCNHACCAGCLPGELVKFPKPKRGGR